MQENTTFTFKGHSWDPSAGIAKFTYELKLKDETFHFTETLTFPQQAQHIPQELLTSALDNLLLVLGISYYKLFCPQKLFLEHIILNKEQAEFWNTLYTKGLGEFFYKNKIDFRGLVSFPFSEAAVSSPVAFPRRKRALVGVGGGKDSIVAGELLKKHNMPFAAFVVNAHPIKEQTIAHLGVKKIEVKRELDPLLFKLNRRPHAYNGHVPVSAQIAFIGALTALLFDYSEVIMANESSANVGSTEYLGQEINHQWSKSREFEELFQKYVKANMTSDIVYFSLLRPFSELKIVELFSKYPYYFPVFSSCNTNFKITKKVQSKWCGSCPKCAFTFIMLAAFLPKEQVIAIFNKNLLADASLLQTYKELFGIVAIKPFDCVGTPDEVTVAFYLACKRGEYGQDPVMMFFEKDVLPKRVGINELGNRLLQQVSPHGIPQEFLEVINV